MKTTTRTRKLNEMDRKMEQKELEVMAEEEK